MAMPSLESSTQEAPESVQVAELGADQRENEELAVLAYQFLAGTRISNRKSRRGLVSG